MMTRRSFLTSTASAAAATAFARTADGQRARREVMVGGRRAIVVDGHAHCVVPEVADVIKGTPLADVFRTTASQTGSIDMLLLGPDRLRQMDEQGIDVEVLSINPWWYGAARDRAQSVIEAQNEGLAAACALYRGRFAPLATVALQHPNLAAAQLEHAVTKLGMRGAGVAGSVNGDELASPKFDVFWSKAQELDALIFLHPGGVPEIQSRVRGNGFLGNVIGNPLETTIALSHLIFEGTLDRFPRLRICAAHGGGFLPSYAGRFDRGCLTFPANCDRTLAKPPSEYLKQIYVDSLVFTPEGLRHLVAECGASRVVLGTDTPYPWTTTAVDHVLSTTGLTDADKTAILGGTLVDLLRLPVLA